MSQAIAAEVIRMLGKVCRGSVARGHSGYFIIVVVYRAGLVAKDYRSLKHLAEKPLTPNLRLRSYGVRQISSSRETLSLGRRMF